MLSSGAIRRHPLEACETEAMEENKMKKRRKFWLFCLLAALVAAIAAPVCLAAENETVVQEETLAKNEKTAVEEVAETVETTKSFLYDREKIVFVLILSTDVCTSCAPFFCFTGDFYKTSEFYPEKTGRIPKKKK